MAWMIKKRCVHHYHNRIVGVALPGTHHFNGDYETVAKTILAQMEAALILLITVCSSVL